jgi:hypothetical protein
MTIDKKEEKGKKKEKHGKIRNDELAFRSCSRKGGSRKKIHVMPVLEKLKEKIKKNIDV